MQEITKVEMGTIDDDVFKGRITLKAYFSNDDYMTLKLYKNGEMAIFTGIWDTYDEGEKFSSGEFYDDIKTKIECLKKI